MPPNLRSYVFLLHNLLPVQTKGHGLTVTLVTRDSSKTVCSMRHHPCGLPHEFAHRAGQMRGAGAFRLLAVAGFVVPHGLDDGSAAQVSLRQALEMTPQMSLDLAFGLGHEPQAGA